MSSSLEQVLRRNKCYTIPPEYYDNQDFRQFADRHESISFYPSLMGVKVSQPSRISPEGGVDHAVIIIPVFNWDDLDDNDAALGCQLTEHLYWCLGRKKYPDEWNKQLLNLRANIAARRAEILAAYILHAAGLEVHLMDMTWNMDTKRKELDLYIHVPSVGMLGVDVKRMSGKLDSYYKTDAGTCPEPYEGIKVANLRSFKAEIAKRKFGYIFNINASTGVYRIVRIPQEIRDGVDPLELGWGTRYMGSKGKEDDVLIAPKECEVSIKEILALEDTRAVS